MADINNEILVLSRLSSVTLLVAGLMADWSERGRSALLKPERTLLLTSTFTAVLNSTRTLTPFILEKRTAGISGSTQEIESKSTY